MRLHNRNLLDVALHENYYSYEDCINHLNDMGVIPYSYENSYSFHIFKINHKFCGNNEERVYFDANCEITYTYEIIDGEFIRGSTPSTPSPPPQNS